MYIVTNTTKIKKDEGYKLINRFDKVGKIEMMEGFLGLEVFSTKKLKDFDQVSVVTRWESEEYFSAWMKSDAFKWAHQRSEEHTSELQSRGHLVCRLLLEKKKKK